MNPIKQLHGIYIAAMLLLASTYAFAQPPFFMEGPVYQIDNQYINVDDRQYPISPTVKVFSVDNKAINLSDIGLNQLVSLRFIYLGNKKMVDEIHKIDALYEFPLPPGGGSNQ